MGKHNYDLALFWIGYLVVLFGPDDSLFLRFIGGCVVGWGVGRLYCAARDGVR